jgi:predicted ATPase with chaperone activity
MELASQGPDMTLAEAIETPRLHRVAGVTGRQAAGVATRLFRAPHHTIADVGLIGGGQMSMPGEVSLAHHGILCLDELPEFTRHVLEALRQPLEEGVFYRQSPALPQPPYVGGVRQTDDTPERFVDRPVVVSV